MAKVEISYHFLGTIATEIIYVGDDGKVILPNTWRPFGTNKDDFMFDVLRFTPINSTVLNDTFTLKVG